MRLGHSLRSLLAIAMAAALLFVPRPASAQAKEILLPFTFNEVAKGEVTALLEGDDAFLSVGTLEHAGVTGTMWQRMLHFARLKSGARRTVNGADYISLKSLAPYLSFKFDEATLTLSVTAMPQLLAETELNVRLAAPADIVYSKDRSTFLNYSVTSQFGNHPSFFGETGTSIAGNLLLNTFQRSMGRLDRLLTSYAIDQRDRLRRWTVGDANAVTDLLGGSELIGGISVARNFNLDPYFVRYPALDLAGTALTPSRVEVYVNGVLVSQQEVPPGPFDLKNIPVQSGAGNAQIVVRDVFGREQTVNQPYYFSTGVLEPGLSEYNYSLGFVRNNYGTKSFDYGSPAFLGFHRVGITGELTAGGRLEASRDLISGGPTATWRTGFGQFDLTLALSDDDGSSGSAASVGYSYLAHSFSFGGVTRGFTRQYGNLSMRKAADRPRFDANLFVTMLLSRANFTLLWTDSEMRDSGKTNRITLLTNVPITRKASLFVSVGSGNQGSGRRAEIFTGFSYFFGGSTSASVTVDHREGKTQTVTEVDRTLPVGTGYGYRLQSAESGGDHTGSGLLQYQTDFGRYEMTFDPYHASVHPTITASGGLVYEAGALLPSRPIQDGFALVRLPGVRDVRVYASNNLVGRTDSHGDLLVPNLLPYYGNRLSIDDRDVPLTYEVQDVEKTVAPPYRGGALVVFPLRRVRTITGSVVVRTAAGEVVPTFGQLTLTTKGESVDSPIGRGGAFYFENLEEGSYDAVVEYTEGTCRFKIEIPGGTTSVVKLGLQTCVEAAKP